MANVMEKKAEDFVSHLMSLLEDDYEYTEMLEGMTEEEAQAFARECAKEIADVTMGNWEYLQSMKEQNDPLAEEEGK